MGSALFRQDLVNFWLHLLRYCDKMSKDDGFDVKSCVFCQIGKVANDGARNAVVNWTACYANYSDYSACEALQERTGGTRVASKCHCTKDIHRLFSTGTGAVSAGGEAADGLWNEASGDATPSAGNAAGDAVSAAGEWR